MKLCSGLFRFARKRVQTTDNDMGMFRDKIVELVEKKDSLSDEEVVQKVDELKAMSADLPDSEDKGKLDRFLEDFKSVKEQDGATAKEAAAMVADLFEKLDTEAMQDVGTDTETVTTEEETEDVPLADGEQAEETAEEVVEETKIPEEEKETKDCELSDYTLEEVYQFIKKRMDEDNGTGDSAEEVEEKKEEEEVVTDNAPRISVTMDGGYNAKGSIAEMFAHIKEGGR